MNQPILNKTNITQAAAKQMTSPARILIVDDSEDAADIAAAYLEEGGFKHLSFATSAAEAFDMIGMNAPLMKQDAAIDLDLIILDIMMPDVDGIEACARMRMHMPTRQVPILMLSGAKDVDALNQAFVAGANDFVGKPVEPVDLLARVRTLLRLGREQQRRELREAELKKVNRNLQRGSIDNSMIDPLTHMASHHIVETLLRQCRQNDEAASLALIQIDQFDLYLSDGGAAAGDELVRKVASIIESAPAPLVTVPCYYGEGTFMIIHPRARDHRDLELSCRIMREAVEEAGLRHSNSPSSDTVSISTLTSWGESEALDAMAPRLLNAIEREWIKGGQHAHIG